MVKKKVQKQVTRRKRNTKKKIVYDVPKLEHKNQRLVIAPASKVDDELMIWVDGYPVMKLLQVTELASIGIDKGQVAKLIRMTRDIFYEGEKSEHSKLLNDAFELGLANGTVKITQALFNEANNPMSNKQMTAAIFWLKNRAGWRDVQDVNNTHDVGKTFAELLRDGRERRSLSDPSDKQDE